MHQTPIQSSVRIGRDSGQHSHHILNVLSRLPAFADKNLEYDQVVKELKQCIGRERSQIQVPMVIEYYIIIKVINYKKEKKTNLGSMGSREVL